MIPSTQKCLTLTLLTVQSLSLERCFNILSLEQNPESAITVDRILLYFFLDLTYSLTLFLMHFCGRFCFHGVVFLWK